MKKPTTLADAIAKRAFNLGYQRGYQAGLRAARKSDLKAAYKRLEPFTSKYNKLEFIATPENAEQYGFLLKKPAKK
jgi:hypothetical protein